MRTVGESFVGPSTGELTNSNWKQWNEHVRYKHGWRFTCEFSRNSRTGYPTLKSKLLPDEKIKKTSFDRGRHTGLRTWYCGHFCARLAHNTFHVIGSCLVHQRIPQVVPPTHFQPIFGTLHSQLSKKQRNDPAAKTVINGTHVVHDHHFMYVFHSFKHHTHHRNLSRSSGHGGNGLDRTHREQHIWIKKQKNPHLDHQLPNRFCSRLFHYSSKKKTIQS